MTEPKNLPSHEAGLTAGGEPLADYGTKESVESDASVREASEPYPRCRACRMKRAGELAYCVVHDRFRVGHVPPAVRS